MAFTNGINYEIILVENGSDQFKQTDVEQWKGKVQLIISKENLGFSGGNNLGISQAKGKYILLLNSDVLFTSDALSIVYNYFKEHPSAGVVSSRLVFPDGRHQSAAQRFPSIKYKLIELFRLQKLLSKRKAGKLLLGSFFDHKESTTADWVWGTFFMFNRDILDQLPNKKLDDTYFMYFEDMQWCMDIKKLGYEIHYCAAVEVVHLMGASEGRKNEMLLQNEALFMQRNYKGWEIKAIKQLNKWLER